MALLLYCNQRMSSMGNTPWNNYIGLFPPMSSYVSRCEYKTDLFNHKLLCSSISEIRKMKNPNFSWEEVMDLRAKELSTLDGIVYIMYSGGVDSTGIIVSIMKNWSVEDLKKVVILCTPSSIHEFPEFFNILVKQFKIEYLQNDLESYTNTGYLVTGMLGDLFFPESDMSSRAFKLDANTTKINYKITGPKLFETYCPNNGLAVFDRLQPIADEAIYPIENIIDFISWLYYTQVWQKVMLAHLTQKNNFINARKYNKVIQFFDHTNFELWGIYNRDRIHMHTANIYKVDPKKYIVDYLGFKLYLNKGKVPSYFYAIFGSEFNYGLDEDWNFLSKEDSLTYLLPN